MQYLLNFLWAAIAAIFIENTIFTRALGTSRLLMVARSPKTMLKFGVMLTAVTTVSGFIAFFANQLLRPIPYKDYLEPLLNVLILTGVFALGCVLQRFLFPDAYRKMNEILLLAVFNCATLGAILLPAHNSMLNQAVSFPSWLGFSFGTGIAFFLATVLVAEGIRKFKDSKIPRSFRGLPASLIYIGILSLAFYGLIGHELPF